MNKQEVAAVEAGPPGKLTDKDYEKELARLHVELVKLQEWVKHEGKKICIVFEGRDTAGIGCSRIDAGGE